MSFNGGPGRLSDGQRLELLSDFALGSVKRSEEDASAAFEIIRDNSTLLEAKTIHRLLETDPRTGSFRRNESEPLDCDHLVIDETSMVDVPLMRAVLRALPERGYPHPQ